MKRFIGQGNFNFKTLWFVSILSAVLLTVLPGCGGDDDSNSVRLPNVPGNFTATGGEEQVTLSWDSAENAETYTVYWNTEGDVSDSDNALMGITGTSYTHIGLTGGAAYYYRMTAVNSDGESGMSEDVSATPFAMGVYLSKADETESYVPAQLATVRVNNYSMTADTYEAEFGGTDVILTRSEDDLLSFLIPAVDPGGSSAVRRA